MTATAAAKWCTACKTRHPLSAFGRDRSRGDGLDATCRAAKSRRRRAPQPREQAHAHRVVGGRVRRGLMPHPNTLPCSRCGHVHDPDEIPPRRHEYHHPNGYAEAAILDVVAVCSLCHAAIHRLEAAA